MLLLYPNFVQAHFIWLLPQSSAEGALIHLYFGELAEPDDPALLDRVAAVKIWQLDANGKKTALSTSKGDEAIEAVPLIKGVPTVIGAEHNFGVLKRGDSSFVLQYYAKTFVNTPPEQWGAIDSSRELKLEILPVKKADSQFELQVNWQGKPLENSELKIEDDKGEIEIEGKTDADGKFSFSASPERVLSIRAKHVEETAGELDGASYSDIRHYSTLSLKL
ncbi:MAG: DUF4198 domain-containing protein [Planctomycetaceae bacterium]